MKQSERASALVFAGTAFLAASIPLLFAYKIEGHRLAMGLRALVSFMLS